MDKKETRETKYYNELYFWTKNQVRRLTNKSYKENKAYRIEVMEKEYHLYNAYLITPTHYMSKIYYVTNEAGKNYHNGELYFWYNDRWTISGLTHDIINSTITKHGEARTKKDLLQNYKEVFRESIKEVEIPQDLTKDTILVMSN